MYIGPYVVIVDRSLANYVMIQLVEIFRVPLVIRRFCMLDIVYLKVWRNKGYYRPWMNMGVS